MSVLLVRGDSIKEYLTGAVSDGASQPNPDLSIGTYRSSLIATSRGIFIQSPLQGVQVTYASGGNPIGSGYLTATPDGLGLQWQPFNALIPGPVTLFQLGATKTLIVEGASAAQYLCVRGTPPFSYNTCVVALRSKLGNVFGLNIVGSADALAGISQYRATIVRNESGADVTLMSRWIAELGTSRVSDQGHLGASGSGTIATSGSFQLWPTSGWCRIQQSGGTLRELVYYSSRTNWVLTVPAVGRSGLGSTAAAGSATDTLHAVPGVAIGLDPAGVQSSGSAITTVANDTTAPASVSWNTGITKATGLSVPVLKPNQQIGIWIWRQIVAGTIYSPNVYNNFVTSFFAF